MKLQISKQDSNDLMNLLARLINNMYVRPYTDYATERDASRRYDCH